MKEYYEDDRFMIPDYIKNMSKEELEAEIARLEKQEQEKKRKKAAAAV